LLDPGARFGIQIRLRDRVHPANHVLVAVDALDERGHVAFVPWPQDHDAVRQRWVGRGDHAAEASSGERQR